MRTLAGALTVLLCFSCPSLAQEAVSVAGKTATLILLSDVSSKLSNGAPFKARLADPVKANGQEVLPAGTVFQGTIKAVRSRRLHRAGSLYLRFQGVRLPNGSTEVIDASLTSLPGKKWKLDSEGTIRPRISRKRLLLEVAAGGLVAKLSDDLAESLITGLSAGGARFFGLGGALVFYFVRRGRETTLPRGTQLEVTFNRNLASPLPEIGNLAP